MGPFRVLLVAIFAGILGYTAIIAGNHGFGLLEVFFSDIAKMGWPGQFNVDFMSLLTLSALWVAWRHHFSAIGIALALLAFFGGGLFLSAYLFLASLSANGDRKELLLGKVRANG
jgi:hypothetical protein